MEASGSRNKFNLQARSIGTVVVQMPNDEVDSPHRAPGQRADSEDIQVRRLTTLSLADLEANGFQVYRLEAECERLMSSSHHFQAADRLKRLHELQPGHVKTMLMLAECYFHLEKYEDSFEIIKEIRDVILQRPRPEFRDLILEAAECRATKKRFASLVVLWCCCFVHVSDRSSKDVLDGISECLQNMDNAIQDVNDEVKYEDENSQLAFKKLCSIFLKMLDEIERLVGGIEISFSDFHTRVLLRSIGCKADCLLGLNRHEEAIQIYKQCIEKMEQKFGANASKCYMFSEFLSNVSDCYFATHDKERGIEFSEKTLTALNNCQPASAEEKARREDMAEVHAKLIKRVKGGKKKSLNFIGLFRKRK